MPSLISNALGTQRQFTAQPDAVYQGSYRDLSPQRATVADTSNAENLGANMERLSQSLQGYAVQHEKYLDAKGLSEAQAMIGHESAAAIEKLNAVDAAQVEGFADSLDNPYFKAYSEKLRGQFLSNRMKDEFDVMAQEHPEWKSSPDELMRQYSNFANNWKDEHITGSIKPTNEVAFDSGYHENNVNELRGLMGDWYKQKKQDDVIVTATQVSNDLDDILMNASTYMLDETGKTMQGAIQKALNPARLMGLSLDSRMTLIKDFLNRGVNSGALPIDVIDKVLPEVVVQATADGKTLKIGDVVSMKALHVDAANYLSRYNSTTKEQFMERFSGDYQGALQELEGIQYSEPDRYQILAPCLPQIKALQIQQEKEAERELKRQQALAAKGMLHGGRASVGRRGAGGSSRYYRSSSKNPDGTVGGYGGHKLHNTDEVNQFITAAVNGNNTAGGLPLDSYSVTPELFYPALKNEISYLAQNGNMEAIYRLMGTKQASALRGSISRDIKMEFNTLRIGDDGHAVIDGKTQDALNAYAQNPMAMKDIFGGDVAKDAYVLHTLVRAYPQDTQQAYDSFVQWHQMEPDKQKELLGSVNHNSAGYTLEGVDNLDGSQGSSTVSVDDPDLKSAFTLGAAALTNITGNARDAINMVGADMAQGYFQYRGAMIPKYVLKGIGTADDRGMLLHTLAQEMTLEDGTIPDSCRLKYDATTRTFSFYDPDHLHLVNGKWTHTWLRNEGYVVQGAHDAPAQIAEQQRLEAENAAVIEEQRRQEAERRAAEEAAWREATMDKSVKVAQSGTMDEVMDNLQGVVDHVNPDMTNQVRDIDYTGRSYTEYNNNNGLAADSADIAENYQLGMAQGY